MAAKRKVRSVRIVDLSSRDVPCRMMALCKDMARGRDLRRRLILRIKEVSSDTGQFEGY
jgi:hypothetical protein